MNYCTPSRRPGAGNDLEAKGNAISVLSLICLRPSLANGSKPKRAVPLGGTARVRTRPSGISPGDASLKIVQAKSKSRRRPCTHGQSGWVYKVAFGAAASPQRRAYTLALFADELGTRSPQRWPTRNSRLYFR